MNSVSNAQSTAPALFTEGVCYVLFVYDAARAIDLDAAERQIHEATQRQTIQHRRRAPSYFEYQPAPLRLSHETQPVRVGDFTTLAAVDLVLYDFGAVSVIYGIPISCPFILLLDLSEQLYDNEPLLADSRLHVEQVMNAIGETAVNRHVIDMVEDYSVFRVASLDQPFDAERFCSTYAEQIAQILRAERQMLSKEEIADAVAARLSFGTEDLIIVDWNAALLVDPEGDDVQAVLEFANVELLEMRYLDRKLDRALDQAYGALSKGAKSFRRFLGYYSQDLGRIAELQVDNVALFEGVNNTLKLLGDQYLARVYRLINRRFHLDEWDSSILRKLQTLESIYEKISNQATNRRMEVLEWVIIMLIATSILLEFRH
jgi:hypothetical protein